MAPTQGLKLYIHVVIYKEMLKNYSSQDLLHQMGQYFAWIIPRTIRLKYVQIKSLGSPMTNT